MINKKTGEPVPRDGYETAIAIFKLTKATLLVAVAIGAMTLLNKNVQEVITYRIAQLGVDPDSKHFQHFIFKLGFLDNKDIRLISIGTFFYAGVFLVEGIGLLMQKRWAEYLTVFVTCSFVPLEVYELANHFSIFKIVVIILNIAIIIYLILRLQKGD